MNNDMQAVRTQVERQVSHWSSAAARMDPSDLASEEAWGRMEQYLSLSIRKHLEGVITRLRAETDVLTALLKAAESPVAVKEVQRRVVAFRHKYVRAETTLDFFADAINTRTSPRMAGLLRACDILVQRSMSQLLDQLGYQTPVALTYVDKGLGASILKAGLRLWDGGAENPAAAIKIVRHNLLRPTALIHEAGHQTAHITNWNPELSERLRTGLQDSSSDVADIWASWSSEIAADAFAFVNTGYASVAALHDVLAAEGGSVFRFTPGDPHPVSYLRVLLGVEMCRTHYGAGPWDSLETAWKLIYPIESAPSQMQPLLAQSIPQLPRIVQITLNDPQQAFRRRALTDLIKPERVSPKELMLLKSRLGNSLYTSMHWLWTECLRLVALTGLEVGTTSKDVAEILNLQETSLLRLGGTLQAA